jgi:hypothetical protein
MINFPTPLVQREVGNANYFVSLGAEGSPAGAAAGAGGAVAGFSAGAAAGAGAGAAAGAALLTGAARPSLYSFLLISFTSEF